MASNLSFAGKTAIITGAGGALGKSYALDLAKRGCNLILNDVFAQLTGNSGAQTEAENAADKLLFDVKKFGVKAHYNNTSVTEGNKIVEEALKHFGRVDVLINNAGNLRDKSFAKMTVEDWDSVIGVHLRGTFMLSHAAWPVMQQQNYGRIINIGSGAGLYGNFGQANYSSAKMGILGLTQTLAKEGEKYNIHVNCVVPIAGSRMTETVLPPDMLKLLKPEHVTPMVTYLAHDSTKVNGTCFEIGGGWYSQIRLERSAGRFLAGDENTAATAENISQNIQSIRDFSEHDYPVSPADAFRALNIAKDRKNTPAAPKSTSQEGATSSTTKKSEKKNIPAKSDQVFEHLEKFLATTKPEDLQKERTKIVYEVKVESGGVKYWFINTRDPDLPAVELIDADMVEARQPHAVLKCDEKTLIALAEGNKSPEMAYMTGALKITGNINSAMKLKRILEMARKAILG